MGLTNFSTGSKVVEKNNSTASYDYTIAIAGNPNVGKSTIFNQLTGMHQHTGNWPGKTVSNASGICEFHQKKYLLVDIPGTYSLMSHSEEEEIARNYICFSKPQVTVVIVDATCLERNLNLVYQTMEITSNIIVCVNLLDEAKKKGIHIDLNALEKFLGVPVVGTIAKKKKTLHNLLEKIEGICQKTITPTPHLVSYTNVIENTISLLSPIIQPILPKEDSYLTRWICLKLLEGDSKIISSIESFILQEKDRDYQIQKDTKLLLVLHESLHLLEEQNILSLKDCLVSSIVFQAETICKEVYQEENLAAQKRDQKIDRILTSKTFGIPIMLIFLGLIFWITITGANYPSALLSDFFNFLQGKLVLLFEALPIPPWITSLLLDGVYTTLTWIIAVMLPPMAIFFPLFTLLEDLGFLPRIAFNMDSYFRKAGSSGKQSLTMCMGVTKWLIFLIR